MFFDLFFLQYRRKFPLTFGSKFMKLHGDLLIGRPERIGFDGVMPELIKSYYYNRIDRTLPVDPAALKRWEVDSILINNYREIEAPMVAKGAVILAMGLCLALVGTSTAILQTKVGVAKLSSLWSDTPALTAQDCRDLAHRIQIGELDGNKITDEQRAQCAAALSQEQGARP